MGKQKQYFKVGAVTVSILLVLSVLTLAIVQFITNSNHIKGRYYPDDRITGSFSMTVSGERYDPDIKIPEDNSGSNRLTASASGFSIVGDEKELYTISFLLDNKELYRLTGDPQFDLFDENPVITFEYFKTSWWHFTTMTLTAEMVVVDNEWIVKIRADHRWPSDGTKFYEDTVEKSFTYNEVMSGDGIIRF